MTLKGLPYTEQGNYVDKYGKLAELFPYKEITSSAEGGPEHEVVAVNEIVRNRNNDWSRFCASIRQHGVGRSQHSIIH